MKITKYVRQNLENCTLSQLLRIKANGYRSSDCRQDYCPFETDVRIMDIQSKQAQGLMEQAPQSGVNDQLAALLPVGQTLLNLIDQALKNLKSIITKGEVMQYVISSSNSKRWHKVASKTLRGAKVQAARLFCPSRDEEMMVAEDRGEEVLILAVKYGYDKKWTDFNKGGVIRI